jgi:hypothetical protein
MIEILLHNEAIGYIDFSVVGYYINSLIDTTTVLVDL